MKIEQMPDIVSPEMARGWAIDALTDHVRECAEVGEPENQEKIFLLRTFINELGNEDPSALIRMAAAYFEKFPAEEG